MTDLIVNHAEKFGFFCHPDILGQWQIISHPKGPQWKLHQQKEDWLLLIAGRSYCFFKVALVNPETTVSISRLLIKFLTIQYKLAHLFEAQYKGI